MGDTNIDLLSDSSNETKNMCRLLRELNAVQLINEPTRVTANSATLLDHIIVDRSTDVKRIGVIDAPSITDHRDKSISDHKLVFCDLVCKVNKPGPQLISYRDFSKFNQEEAVRRIADINWDSALLVEGVDNIVEFISENIKKIFDEQAPIVCKRVTKRRAPWRNNEIKNLSKEKNKLRSRFIKTRSKEDWEKYRKARNKLNNIIRREKNTFLKNLHLVKIQKSSGLV